MPKNKHAKKSGRKKGEKSRLPWTSGYAGVATGDSHLSLRGYMQRQVPDTTLIKMVYSDYRALGAAGSQASYVYRINSCFDPDFTGVGGQPDGFDQWKTLYQQYRVMACHVQIHCVALAGAALCTISPSVSSSVSGSAEENIGLRRARGQLSNVSGQVAKLNALYRTGDIYGVPDQAVLDNDNYAATVTSSPSSSVYVRVECETSGATDTVMIWATLTMYTRFEKPVDTQDSFSRRRRTLETANLNSTTLSLAAPQIGSGSAPTEGLIALPSRMLATSQAARGEPTACVLCHGH